MTVLDASVALAWALPDEHSDAADALMATLEHLGALAPTVWTYEVASGIHVARRRGRLTDAESEQAIAISHTLPIEFVHPRSEALLDIARTTGLSVYDASYLAVCRMHDLPLASFDTRLRDAATALGIDLL